MCLHHVKSEDSLILVSGAYLFKLILTNVKEVVLLDLKHIINVASDGPEV